MVQKIKAGHPPCLREFPDIVDLRDRFADHDDFRLYAVSCGQRDDATVDELRQRTAAFLESRRVTLPTYADQNAASRKAMVLLLGFPAMAYPTTLIFDRRGVIRGLWQGYHPRAAGEMGQLVERLLAEPPDREKSAKTGRSSFLGRASR